MTTPSAVADGRSIGAFTREDAIEALQEYGARYGPRFTAAAFNPATARWQHRPEYIERYHAGRADGRRWPSLNSIRALFGDSFDEARLAAGFEKNKPGPRRDVIPDEIPHPVRTQVVVRDTEKTKRLTHQVALARAREATAKQRADEATAKVRELRTRLRTSEAAQSRDPASVKRVPARTITRTKTVRVKDERALARLRDKLDAAQSVIEQLRQELAKTNRVLRDTSAKAASMAAALDQARADATQARTASTLLADQLAAADVRAERLAAELDAARAAASDTQARAMTADGVQAAERRVRQAELRVATAERIAAEHGAAVTGQLRQLTTEELAQLRTSGPAGPAVFAAAVRKVAQARHAPGGGRLDAALSEVMRAAQTWKDRL